MVVRQKRYGIILLSVLVLLAIPFIAMRFTDDVDWSFGDFLVMGIILLATGMLGDWVLRRFAKFHYRILMIVGIIILFLLIWAELGVGLFGTPFAGN